MIVQGHGVLISFVVDNISSSHYVNCKKKLWITRKKLSINFTKAITAFCLSLHCHTDNNFCLLLERKSLNLKSIIKMLTFQHNFVSELNGFSATESRELSLNENVYNSSGD